MPTTHTEASKWLRSDWLEKVKHAVASTGGAVGVLFVWTDRRNDGYPIPTADFVIKPLAGSAASTRFAEDVLKQVADAASPESIPIDKGSGRFEGIQALISFLKDSGRITPDRAAPYQNAGCFLLQKMMAGYTEMSREYKSGPGRLRAMLNNEALMKNLGKLAAADLIIGNGDRIENGNFANVMFNPQGEIASIDSSAILVSFNQLMKAAAEVPDYGGSLEYVAGGKTTGGSYQMRWVKTIATPDSAGGAAAPTDHQIGQLKIALADNTKRAPVLPPVASLTAVESGKEVVLWEGFERELRGRVAKYANTPQAITPPSDNEWQGAKAKFLEGFREGLQRIDTLLGGSAKFRMGVMSSKAWKGLKEEYKKVGFSGADPNLSWYNLVVRRAIYKKLRGGASMKDAIEAGVALAAKKEGKFLQKGRVG